MTIHIRFVFLSMTKAMCAHAKHRTTLTIAAVMVVMVVDHGFKPIAVNKVGEGAEQDGSQSKIGWR